MRIIPTGILFLTLATQIVCAEGKISMPDFSSYPQSKAFRYFLGQTNGGWYLDTNRQIILAIVFFPSHGSKDVAGAETFCVEGRGYQISENGQLVTWHDTSQSTGGPNTPNGSSGGGANSHFEGKIPEEKLRDLRSAIEQLPNENVSPSLERLAIVSFKKGTNWITHTYDRGNFSPAIQKVCKLVNAQIEMTGTK